VRLVTLASKTLSPSTTNTKQVHKPKDGRTLKFFLRQFGLKAFYKEANERTTFTSQMWLNSRDHTLSSLVFKLTSSSNFKYVVCSLKFPWLGASLEPPPSNMLPLSNGLPWKFFWYTTIQCTPKNNQDNKAIKG